MAVLEFVRPSDSRGNRLRQHLLLQDPNQPVDYLCVDGCGDVVDQIVTCMALVGGRDIDPATLRTPDGSKWLDVYRYPREHRAEVQTLVAVLTNNLTLVKVPELDVGLALDFHMRGCDSGVEHTEAGHLMYRTKYATDPSVSRPAGSAICDRLAEVIRGHPLFATAGLIVAVPSTKTGISERIAESVAHRVNKPWATAVESTGSTAENKDGTEGVTPKQYKAPDRCFGENVIVMDDLYRSGSSMRGVAAAVKAQQAFFVYGLAATRTLRRK